MSAHRPLPSRRWQVDAPVLRRRFAAAGAALARPVLWRPLARSAVASSLIAAILVNTCQLAIADALLDSAEEGQAFGEALRVDPRSLGAFSGGMLQLNDAAGDAIPGSSMAIDEVFPGATTGEAEALGDLYRDRDGLAAAAADGASALDADTGTAGEAWGLVDDTRSVAPYDMADDPLTPILGALNAAVATNAEFTACEPALVAGSPVETTLERLETRSCIRAEAPTVELTLTQTARVTHLPEIEVAIASIPGEATRLRGNLTEGTVTASWSTPGENGGDFSVTRRFTPIDCADLRGRNAPTISPAGSVGVSACRNGRMRFTATIPRNCVTGYTGVGDNDGGRICVPRTVRLDWPEHWRVSNDWRPDDALADLAALEAEGCRPAYVALETGIDTEVGLVDASHPAAGHWPAPPFGAPGEVPPTAAAVAVDFAAGGCTPLALADGPDGPSCTLLEADPACRLVSAEPLGAPAGGADSEAVDVSATHAIAEETYECAITSTLITPSAEAGLVCPGPVRGMGDEFVRHDAEVNTNFAEVASRISAAQFATHDTDCTEGGDPAGCTVFDGEARTCKIAVFGIQNCCESPASVSMADYLALAGGVFELNEHLDILGTNSAVQGAWEYVTTPFAQAWDVAQEGFASGVNSVVGIDVIAVNETAAGGVALGVGQELMQNAAEWTYNTFGDAAVNALFQTVSQSGTTGPVQFAGGALSLNGGQIVFSPALQLLGSVVSTVMWAYTIYSITKILIQIIWACTEDELDTAVKRELKSCHYCGTFCARKILGVCLSRKRSYCCYNSPIARIMQQQIRATNGLDWGDVENPDCGGFTIAEFSTFDLSGIDLDEWTEILADSGRLPGTGDMSLDALTGAGRANLEAAVGDAGYQRLDAKARTEGRLEAMGTEGTILNRAAHQELRDANP